MSIKVSFVMGIWLGSVSFPTPCLSFICFTLLSVMLCCLAFTSSPNTWLIALFNFSLGLPMVMFLLFTKEVSPFLPAGSWAAFIPLSHILLNRLLFSSGTFCLASSIEGFTVLSSGIVSPRKSSPPSPVPAASDILRSNSSGTGILSTTLLAGSG